MTMQSDSNYETTTVDPNARFVAVEAAPAVPTDVTVVREPAVQETVATTTTRRFAFDSMVVGIVGLVLTVVGLLAITRAGFDGEMNEPIVDVVGFTHTTTLGLFEIGIGVMLLICAAMRSRSGAIFFGLVLGVGGFIGAVQEESFDESLALESNLAWRAVVAAAIVVLVSLLVPRMIRTSARVESV